MVTIAARYKNGQIISFKTNTNFFDHQMNTPYLLNEDYFKEKVVEHNFLRDDALPEQNFRDYDSRKGIVAPYEYGIILIDYAKNKMLSCNDYNAMIRGSTAKLLDDYAKLVKSDFIIKIEDYSTKQVTKVDAHQNRFVHYAEIHFIHMALEKGATIKCKNVEIKHDGTIASVVGNIYGISLENKSIDEQLALIKAYEKNEATRNNEMYGNPYRCSLEDYSDISFEYPSFEIIECDNDNEHEVIYNYLQNNEFKLNNYEHEIWKKFIDRRLEMYKEEMDREVDA
jgi:hypothetical protein